jgi:hypothetical protein
MTPHHVTLRQHITTNRWGVTITYWNVTDNTGQIECFATYADAYGYFAHLVGRKVH